MAAHRLPTLNTAPLLDGDFGGSSWTGTTTAYFLSFVQTFDELTDAPNWSHSSRYIAIASAVMLAIILKLSKRKYNVNWCSYSHAFVTGGLSFICVWLNVFAAEPLTGITEPLGSVLCKGPLTTIHSIIPAITMGFGIFDLIEGIGMGKIDFILHGVATFLVMAYFCEVGVPEIIVPMLLMELSTLNLVFMGASFMTHATMFVNIGIFSINFLIYRLIVCPYLWWGIFTATWDNRYNPESQACLPWHFTYVTFFFWHVFQLPQFILVAQNHEKIVLQTYWDGRFESTQHCERFLVYIEYNWSSLINPSSFCFLLAEINLMILIICKFVIQ